MKYFRIHKLLRVSPWNRAKHMLLLENISSYLSAGLSLPQAFKIASSSFPISEQRLLHELVNDLERGEPVASSLEKRVGFSSTILGLIEQGEYSGNLLRALVCARSIIEREDVLVKSCISALTYPMVIGGFALILTIALMRGVMPQITPLLKSLHVDLPLLTRIVMYMSTHINVWGLYMLGIICIGIPLSYVIYKKIYMMRRLTQNIFIRLPIMGSLYRRYQLSLFLRSLGSLIESGVELSYAYKRVAERVTCIPFREYFLGNIDHICHGSALSSIFRDMRRLPPHVAPLVSAGEISGTLGSSLIRASDIIDRDIEHGLKKVTSLIEPIMMIGIGGIVGAIALSIMMPIYDVSRVLQH